MKLKCFIIFLIAIVVVITSLDVLVGYIVKREFHENRMHYKSSISHFEIKCEELLMHPDDEYELFEKNKENWEWSVNEQGENICITNSVKDFVDKVTVVDRTSRRRLAAGLDQRDQYLSCGNKSLAPKSGDLMAMFRKTSYQNVNDNGFLMKVNWDTHPSYSYVDPQFSYHDGEITIPEGRTYFVYASYLFNLTNADRNSYIGLYKLSLRICKKIYGYERTLLGKTEVYNSSVGGIITSLNIAEPGFHAKVFWDLSHSYIHPNVTYKNGEIIIPEERTYFVYASVTFNLSRTENLLKSRPKILTLWVIRKTYGYERTLLGKTEVFTNGIGNIVTSLNVASHVLLQRDDILLVRVSSEECLHQHSKGNTFGLFPI